MRLPPIACLIALRNCYFLNTSTCMHEYIGKALQAGPNARSALERSEKLNGELEKQLERNSSGAFGASGTSDPHALISSCSFALHLARLLTTRPPAAPAPPQPLFSACESVAALRQAMRVCSLAAPLATRPSAALRCSSCRIRLHWPPQWPATTPHWQPRAIPPNGRGL
jgi:hypothetical protein